MLAINERVKHIFILISLSYIFFILGNNIFTLTNPDEVFYVQTAKEMVQHNSWLTPYLFDQPQFEKPIFIYWLLRIVFIIFGLSKFSVRLFPSLFAMLGVIAVYFFGIIGLNNEKKAFISALILMSCFLYIGLSRLILTDMVFSTFILLSMLSFFWGYSAKKGTGVILFFIFSALAVLTKGPLGIILPFSAVAVFLLIRNDIKYFFCRHFLWGLLCFIIISFPWYMLIIMKYGRAFTYEFFYNCHIRRFLVAEHPNDTWGFYPLSTIICMFPWGIFAIFSLKHLIVSIKTGKLIYPFTACWIATIFLIFQAAHSKLVSYVFPFYPAFALLIGDFIYESVSSENNKSPISLVLIVTWFLALFIPTILSLFIARSPHLPITQKSTYCFILILSILSLCVLYFILKRKPIQAVYSLMAAAPMLIFSLFFIHKDIEPHISTRKACEYLLSNNVVDNTILCSKYFARDTRYNTGKRVAIIEIAGKNFFSPHPIPFLDTDLKVKDFLTKQPVTYCLLKKSSAKDIYRIANKEFKVTQLNIIGDKYILKVESR